MTDAARQQHRFAAGATVRVVLHDRAGHTRAPRYVRGQTGRIMEIHGEYRLPDAVVAGDGKRRESVYAVAFKATDLFGTGDHEVIVDLWDSYLEAAESI
jgi:nitrile hydratase